MDSQDDSAPALCVSGNRSAMLLHQLLASQTLHGIPHLASKRSTDALTSVVCHDARDLPPPVMIPKDGWCLLLAIFHGTISASHHRTASIAEPLEWS